MKSLSALVAAVLTADEPHTFVTRRLDWLTVDLGGIPGDRHYGLTRKAGAREPMYRRGTVIRNRRQLSAVSVEECEAIAQQLDLDGVLPEWLGANLLVQGLPNLSLLPTGSRLLLPNGVGLICEGENAPCRHPGEVLQTLYPQHSGLARRFVKAAQQRRGIVCSIECPGRITQGDRLKIIVEPQAAKFNSLSLS